MGTESGGLNRRDFLKKSASVAASVAVTAPLSAVSAAPGVLTFLVIGEGIYETPKEELEQKLKRENQDVYIRSKEKNFLNVGVRHDADMLEAHLEKTFLGQVVQESDIVLLENPQGRYFGQLKKHAQELSKEVINIDRTQGIIGQSLQLYASLWASFRSLKQLGTDWVGVDLNDRAKAQVRKEWVEYVLKTLGISQLGIFPPTLIATLLTNYPEDGVFPEGEYIAKYDISLTGDGRTVFMALDVLRIMEKNPDKKIVVISGDVHAAGINYYLYEAEGQREFKGAVYNLIYGWMKYLPF